MVEYMLLTGSHQYGRCASTSMVLLDKVKQPSSSREIVKLISNNVTILDIKMIDVITSTTLSRHEVERN